MRFEISPWKHEMHSSVIKIQFKYLSWGNHLQDYIPKARKSPGRAVKISIHRECTYSAILSRLKALSRRKGLKRRDLSVSWAPRLAYETDRTIFESPYRGILSRERAPDSHFAAEGEEKKRKTEMRRKVNKRACVTRRGSRRGACRFLKRFVEKRSVR